MWRWRRAHPGWVKQLPAGESLTVRPFDVPGRRYAWAYRGREGAVNGSTKVHAWGTSATAGEAQRLAEDAVHYRTAAL